MERPTLRQLDYVVAVAEAGTFGAAAEAVHVSQPALSAQIAEVEHRLGVTLFERDRRGARVTPDGAEIVAAARTILGQVDELVRNAAARSDNLLGALTLGAIPTVAPYLFPSLVAETRRRYPEVQLRLLEARTAGLVAGLRAGTIDLGVLASPVPELGAGIETVELAHDPFLLAVPAGHPFAGRGRIPRSALIGLPMLLLEEGHCLREHAAHACTQLGISPLGSLHATGLSSLTQMVAAGMGTTLIPACAVGVEARPGTGLSVRRLRNPEPFRTIVIGWRAGSARAPQFRTLAEALAGPVQAVCQPIEPGWHESRPE